MTLRYLTAGESHGPALCGILDGMPAGVEVQPEDFEILAKKRWAGYGRGKRKSIENDSVEVLSGIVAGKTIGSPISLLIRNNDFAAHRGNMAPFADERSSSRLSIPLPGHADFAGAMKFGFDDCRHIRERASARETAMRTALSVPARNLLLALDINFVCMVEKIGDISAKIDYQIDPDLLKDKVEENSDAFMTPDFDVCEPWRDLIDKSRDKNESLGGTAAVIFWGLPVGLGSHTQHDLRLDSILAARIMSIPAVRAVECGNAVEYCSKPGMYADALKYDEDRGFYRPTNRAAGIEGGMTNGQPLIIRFHMKPLPGGGKVESVDLQTLKSALPAGYRSDVQALQAAAVIAESLLAIELASQLLVSYGGANVEQIQNRLRSVY